MPSLGDKQRAFTRMLADLIIFAYEQGYELTVGDAARSSSLHGEFGVKKGYSAAYSVHKLRLAQDYNLYINREWIETSDHPAWDELHNYWESIGGAKRVPNDANHFSVSHNGYR